MQDQALRLGYVFASCTVFQEDVKTLCFPYVPRLNNIEHRY
jgi:hypothetical protein